VTEKNNTIVLKISKDATKIEVIAAVMEIFGVKVKKVNTVIMKGKRKQRGKQAGQRSSWKKAYVALEQGQSLDIASGSE
jgi:large subunit ribosomal protein L23